MGSMYLKDGTKHVKAWYNYCDGFRKERNSIKLLLLRGRCHYPLLLKYIWMPQGSNIYNNMVICIYTKTNIQFKLKN